MGCHFRQTRGYHCSPSIKLHSEFLRLIFPHVVESTDRFTYLGSDIHSSERFTPEILRRIGLASNIFGRLANIWKRTGLSLQTKIRLYNALVISVLFIWLGDMDSPEG